MPHGTHNSVYSVNANFQALARNCVKMWLRHRACVLPAGRDRIPYSGRSPFQASVRHIRPYQRPLWLRGAFSVGTEARATACCHCQPPCWGLGHTPWPGRTHYAVSDVTGTCRGGPRIAAGGRYPPTAPLPSRHRAHQENTNPLKLAVRDVPRLNPIMRRQAY